jgi:hypothetical protein
MIVEIVTDSSFIAGFVGRDIVRRCNNFPIPLWKIDLKEREFKDEKEECKHLTILDIRVIFPQIFWAASIFFFLYLYLSIFFFWILGSVLWMTIIFWRREFYAFMFNRALRKRGYKGKIKIISHQKAVKILAGFHGTK